MNLKRSNIINLLLDQNNVVAQSNLGYCYANGIGTDIDESQSFKFYKLAADQKSYKCSI